MHKYVLDLESTSQNPQLQVVSATQSSRDDSLESAKTIEAAAEGHQKQKRAIEAEKAEMFPRYGSNDLASIFACLQILASLRLAIPMSQRERERESAKFHYTIWTVRAT